MSIWLLLLIFACGIALVIKGGNIFVDASSQIAEASGIPKFIIGATIVSLATTLPEMLVSVFAAADGKVDMAVGNAIGSVTANTGLILALAMLFMTITIIRMDYIVQILGLIAATILVIVASFSGSLIWWGSVLLIVIFAVFMYVNVKLAKRNTTALSARVHLTKAEMIWAIVKFIFGTVGIVIGSQVLVNSGSEIAEFFHVPERIIAVTLVAIGTSLPELVTTIAAITKKQAGLSIGNLIGANLIDITLILPICSLVSGKALPISHNSLTIDIPICLGILLIGLLPLLLRGRASKIQGLVLLAAYFTYLAVVL